MKAVLLTSMLGIGAVAAQDVFRTDPPSLGGVLFPHFHATAAVGGSTGDEAALAAHGHDPNDEFTLQGIELGMSLKLGEHLRGFANHVFFLDLEDDWDNEWEEAFLKLEALPGGFEVRGGRMLNRIGRQNPIHLHGWDFVDANLITSRMLGDEGLITNSGELTWAVPTPFESSLSVSFGEAVPHDDHGHGHGEEDHDEDHEEDHDEDHDDHEEGLEGEEGLFDKNVVTVRYDVLWNYNDFHRFRFGGSFVTGDNSFGRTTTLGGVDVEYGWYEKGLEGGGRSVRWRNEFIGRRIEFQDEMGGGRGDATELGVSTALLFAFADGWEAGLRYGWVEGVDALAELPERHRISAALTRRINVGDYSDGFVRVQYNHEEHDDFGGEDSIWLQFGWNWGSQEVR